MLERLVVFVVVLILFFNGEIFSQTKVQNINIQANYSPLLDRFVVNHNSPKSFQKKSFDFLIKSYQNPLKISIQQAIPVSLYCDRLGFICRKEMEFQKITSIPLRIRLGSLDYVNYLEQKPNSLKPQP
jgi:hypothetical protein